MNDKRKFYENIADIVDSADISPARRPPGGWRVNSNFVTRWLKVTLMSVAVLLLVLYIADYSLFRFRVATNRNVLGTITVDRFYSIAEKNNRTEFNFAGSVTQTCVHALFPHVGDSPCWYASRHRVQRIEQ
jgi:hypothetical protein